MLPDPAAAESALPSTAQYGFPLFAGVDTASSQGLAASLFGAFA